MSEGEDPVAQVSAFTGLGAAEAAQFLEMAGGNVEMAVGLVMSMMDGGGGGGGGVGGGDALGFDAPSFYGLVWSDSNQPPPDAWAEQGLGPFDEAHPFGFVQHKNGPCGVLAVVNAVLVAQAYAAGREVSAAMTFSDEDLVAAIASIIRTAVVSEDVDDVDSEMGDGLAQVTVCSWAGAPCTSVAEETVTAAELPGWVAAHLDAFKEAGGAVLLVYCLVTARGVDAIRREVAADAGELPLVVGPHALCSMELMSMLMRGAAGGNFTAFQPFTGDGVDWASPHGIGMISKAEIELRVPFCDSLKSPEFPVWVLHGGDHFTLGFVGAEDAETVDAPTGGTFVLTQWNGLPPAGPRACEIRVTSTRGPAGPAPKKREDRFIKPVPGEIDSVVQAHQEDKRARPEQWHTWRYEVVLAIDDPDVDGIERTPDMPQPQIFDQGEPVPGEPWRCAACYRKRYETMCFGQNDADTDVCQHCGKARAEAGWSLWLHYDELPGGEKAVCTARHAPKVITLLRRKWPGADLEMVGEPEDAKWPSV